MPIFPDPFPWRSLAACALALAGASPAAAEVVVRGVEGAPLHEARPAPASIFPDEHIIVAQPSPSEVNPSFLGPGPPDEVGAYRPRGRHDDAAAARPASSPPGEPVWSVLTDVTDENLANLHGVNYSAKMAYGVTGKAARSGTLQQDGSITFAAGRVDFAPEHAATPGEAPNFFPPTAFQPGSVGDADYSPLVEFDNAKSAVFNMPMVAFDVSAEELDAMCDGAVDHAKVHDKVTAICPRDGTVTLQMTLGYTFGKPIFYLSTEANDPLIATLETATYAPALSDLPFALEDAAPGEFAERIYVVANGPDRARQPVPSGRQQRAVGRRPRPAQRARRHPDDQPRLQPDLAAVPDPLDRRGDPGRLPDQADQRHRHRERRRQGHRRIDRRRRRPAQGRRLPGELPGGLPDQLIPSVLRPGARRRAPIPSTE